MLNPRQQHELSRLRGFRTRAAPDLSLTGPMADAAAEFRRLSRGVGVIAAIWSDVVPPALAAIASPVSLARGVLSIRASDAAARHELERFLRAGGEAQLVRRSPVAIRRIKLVL